MWWSFCSFVKNKRIKADQIIISQLILFFFTKYRLMLTRIYLQDQTSCNQYHTTHTLGSITSHSLGSYLIHPCSYLIPYHTNTSGSLPTYTWIILINIYGLYHTPQDHTSYLLGSHLTDTCSFLTYTLVHTSHTHVHTSLTLESYLTQLETYSNIRYIKSILQSRGNDQKWHR